MRAFVRAALEELGVDVDEATSGFDALRVLPRSRPDLVIVDIHMPDINGLELVSFLRRGQHQKTPIIVISTEAGVRDRERAAALGANLYIEKPFTAERLVGAIRELVPGAM